MLVSLDAAQGSKSTNSANELSRAEKANILRTLIVPKPNPGDESPMRLGVDLQDILQTPPKHILIPVCPIDQDAVASAIPAEAIAPITVAKALGTKATIVIADTIGHHQLSEERILSAGQDLARAYTTLIDHLNCNGQMNVVRLSELPTDKTQQEIAQAQKVVLNTEGRHQATARRLATATAGIEAQRRLTGADLILRDGSEQLALSAHFSATCFGLTAPSLTLPGTRMANISDRTIEFSNTSLRAETQHANGGAMVDSGHTRIPLLTEMTGEDIVQHLNTSMQPKAHSADRALQTELRDCVRENVLDRTAKIAQVTLHAFGVAAIGLKDMPSEDIVAELQQLAAGRKSTEGHGATIHSLVA